MFEWGKIKCYWIELQTQETPGLDTKVRWLSWIQFNSGIFSLGIWKSMSINGIEISKIFQWNDIQNKQSSNEAKISESTFLTTKVGAFVQSLSSYYFPSLSSLIVATVSRFLPFPFTSLYSLMHYRLLNDFVPFILWCENITWSIRSLFD